MTKHKDLDGGDLDLLSADGGPLPSKSALATRAPMRVASKTGPPVIMEGATPGMMKGQPVSAGGGGGLTSNSRPGLLGMAGPQRVARPQAVLPVEMQSSSQEMGGKTRGGALRVQHMGHEVLPMVGEEGQGDEEQGVLGPSRSLPATTLLWPGWENTLREADSSIWSQRLKCFEEMGERLGAFLRAAEEGKLAAMDAVQEEGMAKILRVVTEHVNDAHCKVAYAAMEVLQRVVLSKSPVVANHLTTFLPRLFVKLGETKEQSKAQANVILDQCRQVFDVSVLCGAVVRVLADQTDKVKQGMLEFLQAIIPQAGSYLSSPSQLRGLLQRLASMLPGRVPVTLQRALISCLLAIYHWDPDLFFEQWAMLPSDHQTAIKRALLASVPHFDTRLAASIRVPTVTTVKKAPKSVRAKAFAREDDHMIPADSTPSKTHEPVLSPLPPPPPPQPPSQHTNPRTCPPAIPPPDAAHHGDIKVISRASYCDRATRLIRF